ALSSLIYTLLLHCARHHHALHSFPTRRSSDLRPGRTPGSRRTFRSGDSSTTSTAGGSARCSRRGRPPPVGKGVAARGGPGSGDRSEEHTFELQSLAYLVCRLLLEKKKKKQY